jgi:trehalose utilization protein
MSRPVTRVTVWNENVHETTQPEIAAIYPSGIHGAIADGIRRILSDEVTVGTATLAEPEHGLSEQVLDETDVLFWWGHIAHDQVADEVVERVHRHVLAGMGLVVLHSGHFSKPFVRLMGTTCSLTWRNDGDREIVWTVAPSHPIAAGIEMPLVIDRHETYSEYFDVPAPSELVFISSHEGGEVFRSGMTFTRGRGRIFYFSPGDQAYPIYHDTRIQRVLSNAALWAHTKGQRAAPEVRKATREDFLGR